MHFFTILVVDIEALGLALQHPRRLASRYFREVERSQLGENITARTDEPEAKKEASDPTKTLQGVVKQSVTLVNFKKLLPVQLAALVPLVVAGSAYLPFKELLGLLKKILFF